MSEKIPGGAKTLATIAAGVDQNINDGLSLSNANFTQQGLTPADIAAQEHSNFMNMSNVTITIDSQSVSPRYEMQARAIRENHAHYVTAAKGNSNTTNQELKLAS